MWVVDYSSVVKIYKKQIAIDKVLGHKFALGSSVQVPVCPLPGHVKAFDDWPGDASLLTLCLRTGKHVPVVLVTLLCLTDMYRW
jgi:hypothetical protein